MNMLELVSDAWLQWVGQLSWQLAVLICIVALMSWLLRGVSARLRHGLWLVVLVKVFLPPSLSAFWSVGNWAVRPVLTQATASIAPLATLDGEVDTVAEAFAAGELGSASEAVVARDALSLPALLMAIWAAGCLALWLFVAWRYVRLVRLLRTCPAIDEGPLRVLVEEVALELNLRRVPDLHTTHQFTSPFLFGEFRPRIVMPRALVDGLAADELRTILLHELVHWKRRDLWIGWLQVLAQGLFWFHPLLWWANGQLRHERECVCDETVLKLAQCSPQGYGNAIVRVLTIARGRSLVAGSMVGVFERGEKLQQRVEEIMNFEPERRKFGRGSWAALLLFAAMFLPMASTATAKQGTEPNAAASNTDATKDKHAGGGEHAENDQVAGRRKGSSSDDYPRVTTTVPEIGATGVDASLDEISVTFDRDMRTGKHWSWTGGPPLFPPIDKSREPRWEDQRTCVLPVKLKPGKYYRLGVNSTSFDGFRSADGEPAAPIALYFATDGASKSVARRVRVPKVVGLEPKNGATDVDPTIKALRVTFDMPMGGGFSWTGDAPEFPPAPKNQSARWSRDGRTCILPVELKPGRTYRCGLNSVHHINFQSKWGVPLEPLVYEFATGSSK